MCHKHITIIQYGYSSGIVLTNNFGLVRLESNFRSLKLNAHYLLLREC